MPTQIENDNTYLGVAILHAKLSKAKRLQVGACLVTDTGSLVPGVNGKPKALGNDCEREIEGELVTLPETLHAEIAVILRCAKSGIKTQGSVLYLTHSPCLHCSSAIISAGIEEVVYSDEYRDTKGLELLSLAGVKVRQYKEEEGLKVLHNF